ncbi:MAG: DUF5916 domain-containing protein [Vicinamibacterales bacterium]
MPGPRRLVRHAAALSLAAVCLAGTPVRAQPAGQPRATGAGAQSAPAASQSAPVDIDTVNYEAITARAVRVADGQSITIDGKLDEAIWTAAPRQGGFIQREPVFGVPSSERTEFAIAYDDRRIYFAVWCWDDEADAIIASELKRDANLGKGDQIKIAIDTFDDKRNSYVFFTNPLGAYKDANASENGRVLNYDWNAVWETDTTVDARGWYAEIAIPLSQLRFRTVDGDTRWNLQIGRVIRRKNEDAYWAPFPREWGLTGMLRMASSGHIEGLRDLRARRRLEFVPFVTPSVTRDAAAGTGTEADAGAGFDFRVGLTGEITADLTYHTDFAQVEADEEVVNLTRFSLFFPEKRQFFTESAGIFDYGRATATGGNGGAGGPGLLSLFYSRRIGLVNGQEVPIIGGGKVTGRAGPYALGVINITTDDDEAGPGANFTAIRVKRSVLARSSVGAIVLNSQGGLSDYNRSVGVDGGFLFGRHLSLTGLLAGTQSSDLPGDGNALAGVGSVQWQSDRMNLSSTYTDIGRRFNAEMGFIPRVDIRHTQASAAYTPRPRWPGVRQLELEGGVDYYENHDGRVESRTYTASATLQRQDSSNANLTLTRDYDFLPRGFGVAGTTLAPGGYSWDNVSARVNTNSSKRVYGGATVETGGYYSGRKQTVRGNLSFLLGKTLLFEPNYTWNRITLPGRPVYTSNVVNFRVSHSFSPDLYWKAFFQYNDDRRVSNLNLLFWYVYRPGSDLYIVYNNGWDTELPNGRRFQVRDQRLTVKLTYWLSR